MHVLDILGQSVYYSPDGFSYAQIYQLCGRDDRVATISFGEETCSYQLFGADITVLVIYTQSERKQLESDIDCFDDNKRVKAKYLLFDYDKNLQELLANEGFYPKDIREIIIGPLLYPSNTFYSENLREVKTLEIPFEPKGKGEDISWIFGGFKRMIEDHIALSPDEYCQYLAYKIILNDELSQEEYTFAFNNQGRISNKQVAWHMLLWKKEAGLLKENEEEILNKLKTNRFSERMELLNKELTKMGLSLKKLIERYPDKALLLISKATKFYEVRFNIPGKHLLYLDYERFLHIYLRHVKELTVPNQFAERDKFQLAEEDVMKTIRLVMYAVNDEYQTFRDNNLESDFRRQGSMAYYLNGDYYAFTINKNGLLMSFYKTSQNKKR